jgi:hypothetical protein
MATLQSKLEQTKAALFAAAPRLTEVALMTILALMVQRIQSQGLKGVSYSVREVPTYRFFNRALNASGKAYIKQNKLGTWGAFRDAQGLPSNIVNLTYTGGMFRGLLVAQAGNSGTVFRAKIVASNDEAADKVKWNTARYGDFLKPTVAEVAAGRDYIRAEIQKIIKRGLAA